jgi:SSS family transporter
MSGLLLALLMYVGAQLAIGAWVSRRVASEDDYLLAGRRFGYGLAGFSIFATWFGAETCLGAAGSVYTDGVSFDTTEPFAYGACLVLLGVVFAAPLWRRRLTTLADLFRARFSPGVERVAALLMIPTSVLWAAAQIRAFGQVLAATSTLDVHVAIVVAASLVIAYTAMGGLLADAITDVVQGLALIAGLVVLTVAVVVALGGPAAAWAAIEPGRLPLGGAPKTPLLATAEAWAAPLFGSVVAQELVARISASRSAAVARRASIGAGCAYLAIGSVPVFLGLAGAVLLPDLADAEQILPHLAQQLLPGWAQLLFVGALVSAILSTVDSTLLVSSSLLSHNLVQPALPALGERAKLRLARAGVIGFGLVATGIALAGGSVASLVHEASALGSAGILVVVVFGLFSRWGGAAAAYASLLTGVTSYVGAVIAGCEVAYLLSLAASLVAYTGFALVPRREGASARD